jgi:3-hydroxy-9,10-secoandrosta-1,3,5(10)-triene-9,17-dione monooxygenase reductase component
VPNTQPIDSKLFRRALGSFTTGVTIVTTKSAEGKDAGLTANSFNSASLTPPMVLWSLDKKSSNLEAFNGSEHFAVHIFAADQEQVSNQFAKSGIDRFAGLNIERGVGDVPLLTGCSARFECRVAYRYEGGDHIIFVGEVLSFESFDRVPLVFHGGKYGLLVKPEEPSESGSDFGVDFLGFLLRRTYAQFMMPVRNDTLRRGLNEAHRNIMSILSMGDGRSIAEVCRLAELTGPSPLPEHFYELADKGFVALRTAGGIELVFLTDAGRECAIEHMAVGKAAEADAMSSLSHSEARLLKTLLQRIIRHTSDGLPECWRKDNFWRDNNLWGAAAPSSTSDQQRELASTGS